jgi:hypothetical protein
VRDIFFVIVLCVAACKEEVIPRQEAEVVLRFVGHLRIEIRVVWRCYCFGVAPSQCHFSDEWMQLESVPHDFNVEVISAAKKQIVLAVTHT